MTAESTIRAGQRMAESLMVDRCEIVRIVRARDPETYVETPTETVVYGGPSCPWRGRCKVQTYEPDAIDMVSAGRAISVQEDRLHVPVGAGPFQIGDLAYVEGYSRPYRIDGLILKTFQTAQRLKVSTDANKVEAPNGADDD